MGTLTVSTERESNTMQGVKSQVLWRFPGVEDPKHVWMSLVRTPGDLGRESRQDTAGILTDGR